MKFGGIIYSTKIIKIPAAIGKTYPSYIARCFRHNTSHQNDGYMVQSLYVACAVAMKMKEAIG